MILTRRLWKLVHAQRGVIERQRAELACLKLEHARASANLLEGFLYATEHDIDVTAPVQLGLRDLRDEVARLEEHAPS